MLVNDFDYVLPDELIAQTPIDKRDSSRLLVLDRSTGEVAHKTFRDIYDELQAGDVLVVNDTKVFKARTFADAIEKDIEGVEIVFLRFDGDVWEVLIQGMRKYPVGNSFDFGGPIGKIVRKDEHKGVAFLRMNIDQPSFMNFLEQHGELPLPPYIQVPMKNTDRYQTTYAREVGSVAAPTAGLHFTAELLRQLQEKGVQIVSVTLHVGVGTFQPLWWETLDEHVMHAETVEITPQEVGVIRAAKAEGRRVIAVGTTTTRALEGVVELSGGELPVEGYVGEVNLFIKPGFEFKVITGLLTNFHLPKTTLLVLVSAFAGRDRILQAYGEAIRERYRFFSFGDAMFIR